MSEENKIPFSRIFWPSLVAVAIALFLGMVFFFLVLGGIIGSFANFGPAPYALENASILRMNLKGKIQEKSNDRFDPMSFSLDETLGLPDILYAIDQAKKDEKIKGIYVDIGELNCGISTLRSIRSALNNFQKDSKKFVVAYFQGESISQKEYYLGSVAKECYAFPTSTFYLTGLGSEAMFFKKMLDKLDVEVQIVRGENNDFKSAVEPFFLEKLSDSARLQNQRLMDCIWGDLASDMASSRNFSVENLNQWINSMEVVNAQEALKHRMVDGVLYEDEMMATMAKKVAVTDYGDISWADFTDYAKNKFYNDQVLVQAGTPSIAVIIGEGEVSKDGEELSSEKLCKLFSKVRKDKHIKAVVFRINSPGGSALASEEIWREVMLTQKKKKVFVSMGDVAASGGYYIATPADRIFAEPTTITGSIGVFGMIPYTGKMLENKLGITFDRVQTHDHAVMSSNRKLTTQELSMVQTEVNGIYSQFLQRVADGRKMTKERVNQLARGRVWSGSDALERGLVDQLATLPEVIAFAKQEIKSKEANVIYYPRVKEDPWGGWIKLLNQENDEEESRLKIHRNSLPESLNFWYDQLKRVENKMGIQMRMPYELVVSF
ncbi:MAG: signal peptide peptidase SppA [Flavobacteriia bacterium]|nr:signal peptide peptidase SppA [Flavobacteriia bacterium]